MAGLLGFALAGALGGFGQGIVQQAQQRREMFLEDLRHQRRQDERMQDRQWRLEDRETATSRAAGGGRRGGGSGGGSARLPAAVQTWQHVDDNLYGAMGGQHDEAGNRTWQTDSGEPIDRQWFTQEVSRLAGLRRRPDQPATSQAPAAEAPAAATSLQELLDLYAPVDIRHNRGGR